MRRTFLFLIAVCLAAPAWAAGPAVDIVSAEFGLFDARNPDELVLEPGNYVPLIEGQRYGWVIEVRTTRRSLAVREEYLWTPRGKSADASAAQDDRRTIVFPQRRQVSQRQLVPVEGKIFGEWAVGPGEPTGRRHLQVFVEGQLAADFEYDIR